MGLSTTPRSSTRETFFRLAFKTDVMVPVEVGLGSYQTEVFNEEMNEFRLRANVDFLEKER